MKTIISLWLVILSQTVLGQIRESTIDHPGVNKLQAIGAYVGSGVTPTGPISTVPPSSYTAKDAARYGWPAPPYRPQASDFRIVGEQIYNTKLSRLWGEWIQGPTMSVIKVMPDGVLFRLYETVTEKSISSASPSIYRSPIVTSHRSLEPAGSCFVRNFPQRDPVLTSGDRLPTRLWLMRISPVKVDGENVPAYDCGLPNTPENYQAMLGKRATKSTNTVAKAVTP